MATEKSGSDEFDFEYGTRFAEHIESFRPTFAKALVRYNPEGDEALTQRQTARLTELSDYCRTADQRFMFELLAHHLNAEMLRPSSAPGAGVATLNANSGRQAL